MKQKNTGRIMKSKQTENFTIIPNGLLRDQKLSLEAKGLLCILLHLPSDWVVYKTQLQQFSKNGRDSTIKAFNELVDNNYIIAIRRINSKGQFMGWDYVVYNERYEPIPENPKSDIPNSDNQLLQSTNEQSTKIQSTNYTGTSNTGLSKFELKTKIIYNLNLNSKQLNKHIEEGFSDYSNPVLLEQNKDIINEYIKLVK